jgi:hypothetical protein
MLPVLGLEEGEQFGIALVLMRGRERRSFGPTDRYQKVYAPGQQISNDAALLWAKPRRQPR